MKKLKKNLKELTSKELIDLAKLSFGETFSEDSPIRSLINKHLNSEPFLMGVLRLQSLLLEEFVERDFDSREFWRQVGREQVEEEIKEWIINN